MYTRSLSREASHVWAVDLSMEMLKQAKLKLEEENLENVTLARADTLKLPFSDDQFQGVSCMMLCNFSVTLMPHLQKLEG
ncbi:class I SAM-dependent methyltransferase [Methanobacterium lacus]|uniref:class I SAM-dependent methyltransferase n=1 Tax=Methanobacterium lacus (strain AL-21) TaxID=877455 RepID=UPI000A05D2EB